MERKEVKGWCPYDGDTVFVVIEETATRTVKVCPLCGYAEVVTPARKGGEDEGG